MWGRSSERPPGRVRVSELGFELGLGLGFGFGFGFGFGLVPGVDAEDGRLRVVPVDGDQVAWLG